jgi:hypothetical protein
LTISTNDEETIVPDAVQTPTSKLVGKKLLSLDGVRRSTTKESIVPTEEVGMINSIEAPTSKQLRKGLLMLMELMLLPQRKPR